MTRARMIEGNLRLVVSVARRYRDRGVAIEDLVREGVIGLMRAADLFDHRRGTAFSTYATWWIRQAVTGHRRRPDPGDPPARAAAQRPVVDLRARG